jgi:hypothetical protein
MKHGILKDCSNQLSLYFKWLQNGCNGLDICMRMNQ